MWSWTNSYSESIQNYSGCNNWSCTCPVADGMHIWSRLDLLLITKQLQQKANHDQHAESRSFNSGDTVYARNYSGDKEVDTWNNYQDYGPEL